MYLPRPANQKSQCVCDNDLKDPPPTKGSGGRALTQSAQHHKLTPLLHPTAGNHLPVFSVFSTTYCGESPLTQNQPFQSEQFGATS